MAGIAQASLPHVNALLGASFEEERNASDGALPTDCQEVKHGSGFAGLSASSPTESSAAGVAPDEDAWAPCEWPDACDACFADESWSAQTELPQTVPAANSKEPSV